MKPNKQPPVANMEIANHIFRELMRSRHEEEQKKTDPVQVAYVLQKQVQKFYRAHTEETLRVGLKMYKDEDRRLMMGLVNSDLAPDIINAFVKDEPRQVIRDMIHDAMIMLDSRLEVRPYFFDVVFDDMLKKEPYSLMQGLEMRVVSAMMSERIITDALTDIFAGDVSKDVVVNKTAKWLDYFNRNYDPDIKELFKSSVDRQGAYLEAQTRAVREEIEETNKGIKKLEEERAAKSVQIASLEKMNAIEDELAAWVEKANADGGTLTKNDATRAHKWLTAIKETKIIEMTEGGGMPKPFMEGAHKVAQSYLVRHNWGAALGESIRAVAKDDGPIDVMLPYDVCFFEFFISGRCVILAAFQKDCEVIGTDNKKYLPPSYIVAIECEHDYWFQQVLKPGALDQTPFLKSIRGQVEGICVALEAEIAVSEKKEPDVKLNKKRIANGKPPLMSYHVIDLAIKKNRGYRAPSQEYQGIVRCHLRAGHWRKLDDVRKIRIKWMLVGNPDLGFVSKHYLV